MVKIPAGDYVFKVQGIEIEGSDDVGVDVQYSWEDSPRRFHEHRMHVDMFYLDKYPVTNADFKKFLDATHYHPQDDLNFLRDWKNGGYPEGWAKKPVTWVSLEDARAYAKWAGKRLPHEWEWQYAAQGEDGRRYPWGNYEGPATPAAAPAMPVAQPQPAPAAPSSSPTPAPAKGPVRSNGRTSPQSTVRPNSQPNPVSTDKPASSEACPTCPPVVMGSTPDP